MEEKTLLGEGFQRMLAWIVMWTCPKLSQATPIFFGNYSSSRGRAMETITFEFQQKSTPPRIHINPGLTLWYKWMFKRQSDQSVPFCWKAGSWLYRCNLIPSFWSDHWSIPESLCVGKDSTVLPIPVKMLHKPRFPQGNGWHNGIFWGSQSLGATAV